MVSIIRMLLAGSVNALQVVDRLRWMRNCSATSIPNSPIWDKQHPPIVDYPIAKVGKGSSSDVWIASHPPLLVWVHMSISPNEEVLSAKQVPVSVCILFARWTKGKTLLHTLTTLCIILAPSRTIPNGIDRNVHSGMKEVVEVLISKQVCFGLKEVIPLVPFHYLKVVIILMGKLDDKEVVKQAVTFDQGRISRYAVSGYRRVLSAFVSFITG